MCARRGRAGPAPEGGGRCRRPLRPRAAPTRRARTTRGRGRVRDARARDAAPPGLRGRRRKRGSLLARRPRSARGRTAAPAALRVPRGANRGTRATPAPPECCARRATPRPACETHRARGQTAAWLRPRSRERRSSRRCAIRPSARATFRARSHGAGHRAGPDSPPGPSRSAPARTAAHRPCRDAAARARAAPRCRRATTTDSRRSRRSSKEPRRGRVRAPRASLRPQIVRAGASCPHATSSLAARAPPRAASAHALHRDIRRPRSAPASRRSPLAPRDAPASLARGVPAHAWLLARARPAHP